VISLGGGAFMNENIRKEVLKSHISFWLNWNKNILLKRIKNSKKRPIAINSSDDQILSLIQKRSNVYAKASFEIKCDNLTKNEVVNKIIKIYESN
jgi:shikimate kinase/shikimate kinase/3-dehydroquinate synthase